MSGPTRLSQEDAQKIIQLWLYEVMSYPQIRKRTGRSLDTIHKIITNFKSGYPDIDSVRDAISKTKQQGKTIPDVLRTLMILEKLEQNGVSSGDIAKCAELLKKYGNNSNYVLDTGVRIQHELDANQISTAQLSTFI